MTIFFGVLTRPKSAPPPLPPSPRTIVLLQEPTKQSRMIPSFQKKNERIERVFKNIGTICKGTERERND